MSYERNAEDKKCQVCGTLTKDWRPVVRGDHVFEPGRNRIPCCESHNGAFFLHTSIFTTATGRREEMHSFEWESWGGALR